MANTYYRSDSLRSHIFFFLPMPNICRCRAGNGTIDSPPIIESFMSRRGFKTAPSSSLYDLYNNLIIKILCRGGSKIISLSLSFSMNRFLEKFVFNLQAAAYQTFFSPVSCTNPPQCSVIWSFFSRMGVCTATCSFISFYFVSAYLEKAAPLGYVEHRDGGGHAILLPPPPRDLRPCCCCCCPTDNQGIHSDLFRAIEC